MSEKITSEDRERVALLQLITNSKHEFNKLSVAQLTRLQELLEKKDYSHDKKAEIDEKRLFFLGYGYIDYFFSFIV